MPAHRFAGAVRSRIRLKIIKNIPKVLFLLFVLVILTSLRLTNLARSQARRAILANKADFIKLAHDKVTLPKLKDEIKEIESNEEIVEVNYVEEVYEVIECFDNPSSIFEDDSSSRVRVRKVSQLEEIDRKSSSRVISLDTQFCPVCFGKDQCEEISEHFEGEQRGRHSNTLVEIKGTWKGNSVTLTNFGNSKPYREFDDLVNKLFGNEETFKKHFPFQPFKGNSVLSMQSVHNGILNDIHANISNNM
ncbi:uncharacterized protein LOC117104272 [Anneissia japonica]|uniref:uncharacterized protein LOC117104272 n=1 Tax=Anneissia japonica TaxID=1529436 RepID=UPI0014256DA5|nr:uncharacterized protein LOC117104272 [Anneissia japonica]